MRNWCHRCNGSGKIQSLDARWWQFWVKMDCPVCNGTKEILPPKEKPRGIPPAPPPVSILKCSCPCSRRMKFITK